MRAGQTMDFKGVSVEVYNPHLSAVIMSNTHPLAHLQAFNTLRIRIEPGAFAKLPHLHYSATFEDGSACPPLTVNFGKAKGKGIKSPSQYRHNDHA
ncbi:MAG: hypothetical protein NDJ89_09575 [Oligoflexia bacterium]|nr:hypothetical protein [Oligoflexia bacterium]